MAATFAFIQMVQVRSFHSTTLDITSEIRQLKKRIQVSSNKPDDAEMLFHASRNSIAIETICTGVLSTSGWKGTALPNNGV